MAWNAAHEAVGPPQQTPNTQQHPTTSHNTPRQHFLLTPQDIPSVQRRTDRQRPQKYPKNMASPTPSALSPQPPALGASAVVSRPPREVQVVRTSTRQVRVVERGAWIQAISTFCALVIHVAAPWPKALLRTLGTWLQSKLTSLAVPRPR